MAVPVAGGFQLAQVNLDKRAELRERGERSGRGVIE
jgi:hypothetical protein